MKHHPVFAYFRTWSGELPKGSAVNFLGVIIQARHWALSSEAQHVAATQYPGVNEEYFEWIDLLEAVRAAEGQLTMLELGAGWGRWSVNAAFAVKQFSGLPYHIIAVEAEPTHFKWLEEHIGLNGLNPVDFQLVPAAVTAQGGTVGFWVGERGKFNPTNWYGQSVGGPTQVKAVTLNSLLEPLTSVDLIDLDIQGSEVEVLESSGTQLDAKVKRLHIGTHGGDALLLAMFERRGWKCLRAYTQGKRYETEFGPVQFQDGVQSWLNPRLTKEPVYES